MKKNQFYTLCFAFIACVALSQTVFADAIIGAKSRSLYLEDQLQSRGVPAQSGPSLNSSVLNAFFDDEVDDLSEQLVACTETPNATQFGEENKRPEEFQQDLLYGATSYGTSPVSMDIFSTTQTGDDPNRRRDREDPPEEEDPPLTPEPATLLLVGCAMGGLLPLSLRRRKK